MGIFTGGTLAPHNRNMKILLVSHAGRKGEVYKGKTKVLLDNLVGFPIYAVDGPITDGFIDKAISDGYTALLHRNEHGRLFADSSLPWITEALEKKLPVISFDFGYIDHYKSFMFDFYLEDLSSSIKSDWEALSKNVDWGGMPKYLQEYRWKILEKIATTDGSEFHGCVAVWMQWNADLLRNELHIAGKHRQWEWINQVCKRVYELGLKPVIKMNIVNHSEVYDGTVPNIDPGLLLISERAKIAKQNKGRVKHDADANWKLLSGCVYHIFMSSSVSHLFALSNKPAIAMGKSWFNGMDIFSEPKNWAYPLTKPLINQEARAKWFNWWFERQCQWGDSAKALTIVHDKAVNYYGRS